MGKTKGKHKAKNGSGNEEQVKPTREHVQETQSNYVGNQ